MTTTAIADAKKSDRRTKAPFTILVVEDNPTDVELMLHALEQADLKPLGGEFEMEVRPSGEGALQLVAERGVDLVLADIRLPGMDGLELVSRLQSLDRNLPVLVVTRMNTIQLAVDAMRRGAFDYLLKPVNPEDLGMRLHRAIRISEILRRHAIYEQRARIEFQAGKLVGVSPVFDRIMRSIRDAAQVRSTVLITGETGTGKGLIARTIHEQSPEQSRPFQVIDCATVPEGTMESELFGHVRGAFTGAIADKPGLIELADGGTVFFDEIGDLPLALQGKLLRVLEENEVRRVGGTRVKRVDMRIIAATNQDLEKKVEQGGFRKDLYYRLAVLSINVPPLRERPEDIPILARQLLQQLGREMVKPHARFDQSAVDALVSYSWPGNVRELRNVVERALMLATEETITAKEIRLLLPSGDRSPRSFHEDQADLTYMDAKERAIADFTRAYLRTKLRRHGGVITKAAESSGIPRQHFSMLMKRYLSPDESKETK